MGDAVVFSENASGVEGGGLDAATLFAAPRTGRDMAKQGEGAGAARMPYKSAAKPHDPSKNAAEPQEKGLSCGRC